MLAFAFITQGRDGQCFFQNYIELNILQYGKTDPVPYSHATGELFSE